MSNPSTNNPTEEIVEDYLEEDKEIPGQKYVCLSFVSPEKILDDKKVFSLYKFHKSMNKDSELTYAKFKEDFDYFCEDHEKSIQDEFDQMVDFKTNVRGIKVRGVYDNLKAANIRAKVLQKLDRSFHVYVGQVGFWLPWEPNANKMEDQEYLEQDLNRLVKEYNKNQTKKDIFYEEQKQEKKKAAMEHAIKQKQENERLKQLEREQNALENTAETSAETTAETTAETSAETSAETTAETTDETSAETSAETTDETSAENGESNLSLETTPTQNENSVDEELKTNLDKMDPWMERKMEESGNTDTTNNEA